MWCGADAPSGWATDGTLNPCYFDTVAAATLACIAAVLAWRRHADVAALARLGRDRAYLWAVPGSRTPHAVQTAAAAGLACLHALILAVSLGVARPAPYAIAAGVAVTLAWAAIAVRLIKTLLPQPLYLMGSILFLALPPFASF